MAVEIVVKRSIWEPLQTDVDSYCWHPDGWEDGTWGSIQDARKTTRGEARACYAREIGEDFRDVGVWRRRVRSLTRIEAWEDHGRDQWAERFGGDEDEGPDLPPDSWEPDPEGDPAWEFVYKAHPEAIPVWVCGPPGRPPHDPRPTDPLVLARALNRKLCREQGHAWGVEDCLRCHEPISARETIEHA